MTTWLKYIIETSWNKHQVTIHKIHRRIHSEVTYTSTGLRSKSYIQRLFVFVLWIAGYCWWWWRTDRKIRVWWWRRTDRKIRVWWWWRTIRKIRVWWWWCCSKDQSMMMMMLLFEISEYDDDDVAVRKIRVWWWWCCWSKGQSAEDDVADRKVKVLKIVADRSGQSVDVAEDWRLKMKTTWCWKASNDL